jgi:hypothetical protein
VDAVAELSMSEQDPRPLGAIQRTVAAALSVAFLCALWGWAWALVIGLGQLFRSTEDGACQQPEYVYGAALILLGIGGVTASVLGIRGAGRVALGRGRKAEYVGAAAATVLLAIGVIATVTVLKPNFTLLPGPC